LNERFLCAELSQSVTVTIVGKQLELRVVADGSSFSMPLGDAVLLPVANTSVEELCAFFARNLVLRLGVERLRERKVDRISVCVKETLGQGASFAIDFPPAAITTTATTAL
jgi:hypothetical protein